MWMLRGFFVVDWFRAACGHDQHVDTGLTKLMSLWLGDAGWVVSGSRTETKMDQGCFEQNVDSFERRSFERASLKQALHLNAEV